MRLIHSTNLEFRDFFDSDLPNFAILSHCWDGNEVSYYDFLNQTLGDARSPKMKKILDCCALAKEAQLDWVWVDTCLSYDSGSLLDVC